MQFSQVRRSRGAGSLVASLAALLALTLLAPSSVRAQATIIDGTAGELLTQGSGGMTTAGPFGFPGGENTLLVAHVFTTGATLPSSVLFVIPGEGSIPMAQIAGAESGTTFPANASIWAFPLGTVTPVPPVLEFQIQHEGDIKVAVMALENVDQDNPIGMTDGQGIGMAPFESTLGIDGVGPSDIVLDGVLWNDIPGGASFSGSVPGAGQVELLDNEFATATSVYALSSATPSARGGGVLINMTQTAETGSAPLLAGGAHAAVAINGLEGSGPPPVLADYQLDDGTIETQGFQQEGFQLLWLNQFDVQADLEQLDSIDAVFGDAGFGFSGLSGGEPVTVMVYDDPNNDGNPDDFVLLDSISGTITEFDTGNAQSFTFSSPVPLGDVGDSFFVGVSFTFSAAMESVMAFDQTNPAGRSWSFLNITGDGDISDPGTFMAPVLNSGSNFMIRGNGSPGSAGPPMTASVTTLLDENDGALGMGMGDSLRECLAAVADGGTVDFMGGLTGTITLSNGELLIDKSVDIMGPGADVVTVSGDNASRVFNVMTGTMVSIDGLTIADGNADFGAGIFSEGSLTISNSAIINNSATLDLGGGIFADGLLTIMSSTISGNQALNVGGGIYTATMMIMSNSTVSGNLMEGASSSGGGIFSDGDLDISDSTIVNNMAIDGGSDGGVAQFGSSFMLSGSIIANNTATMGDNDVNGSINSQGFNLIGDVGSATGFVGSDILGMDPMLDVLADNGGPTQTHALLAGSPAVDAGDPASMLATDQRGEPRMQDNGGGAVNDIGAYEAAAGSLGSDPLVVTTLEDAGTGSLREAILAAGPGDTIDLTGVSGEICLDSRLPRVPRGVMLVGIENVTLNLNCD